MKKFYQLGIQERWQNLVNEGLVIPNIAQNLTRSFNLNEKQLSIFTENVISQFHLPVGLVKGLKVNGKKYLIPIATYEPSVVAALNKATHYVNQNKGIIVTGEKLPVSGQIFINCKDKMTVNLKRLRLKETELKQIGESAVPNLVKRGGGIKRLTFNAFDELLVVTVITDTGEAMGANLVDTIVEKLAPVISKITGGEIVSAILSNLPSGEPFKAQSKIPIDTIGIDAAKKIEQLSDIGQFNLPRATTNNKGVMNGLIGAVIATGNDDRAVNAAMNAYLIENQQYSLTCWKILKGNLVGTFKGYLPIGTVGGAISTHPDARNFLSLLKTNNSTELSHVLMAVGLSSNFSALLALVTDGIQEGHMRLQAKSIALNAGVGLDSINRVVAEMIRIKKFDTLTARKINENIKKGQI